VALLGDLANMVDASLAKAFGVLFEAPWMEAKRLQDLGVLMLFWELLVVFVRH
jgi:hypothetical protein